LVADRFGTTYQRHNGRWHTTPPLTWIEGHNLQ
jgi:hypothetical protein